MGTFQKTSLKQTLHLLRSTNQTTLFLYWICRHYKKQTNSESNRSLCYILQTPTLAKLSALLCDCAVKKKTKPQKLLLVIFCRKTTVQMDEKWRSKIGLVKRACLVRTRLRDERRVWVVVSFFKRPRRRSLHIH